MKKRGYKYEREKGGVYERFWREEMKGDKLCNCAVISKKYKKYLRKNS